MIVNFSVRNPNNSSFDPDFSFHKQMSLTNTLNEPLVALDCSGCNWENAVLYLHDGKSLGSEMETKCFELNPGIYFFMISTLGYFFYL